jgi:hypothetical protein
MKTGIERIADERKRQTASEGWTPEHDAHHAAGELGWAAAHYAAPGPAVHEENGEPIWPFDDEFNKKHKHDRIRQLEIAGALCAAEIDRLLQVT